MTISPDMRAGDEDRDRTVSLIREAYAEGRLTTDEFQQRMDQAHQSKTYGELAALTTDLPAMPTPGAPPAAATSGTVATPDRQRADLRKAWAAWAGVSILVNVIWAATWISNPDSSHYYWPIWVMGPWGAAMAISWLTHRAGGGSE